MRWGACAVLGALTLGLLCGCTPGLADPGPAASASPASVGELVVRTGAARIETTAGAVRAAGPLMPGDRVSVTGTGAMVEVDWQDGAITRLADGTALTIAGPAAPEHVRGVQDGGMSWSRVPDGAAYALRVGEEVVADRGPFFLADCRGGACRVRGSGGGGGDGSMTTVRWGSESDLVADGGASSWADISRDPWAQQNLTLDEAAGLPTAAVYEGGDPRLAVVDGTYRVHATMTAVHCTGSMCEPWRMTRPGLEREETYVLAPDCGPACPRTVRTEYLDLSAGLTTAARTLPVGRDRAGYTWGYTDVGPICTWTYADGSTAKTGTQVNTLVWHVWPTAAEVVDGRFVATGLRGHKDASITVKKPVDDARYPGCRYWQSAFDNDWDLTLVRSAP